MSLKPLNIGNPRYPTEVSADLREYSSHVRQWERVHLLKRYLYLEESRVKVHFSQCSTGLKHLDVFDLS